MRRPAQCWQGSGKTACHGCTLPLGHAGPHRLPVVEDGGRRAGEKRERDSESTPSAKAPKTASAGPSSSGASSSGASSSGASGSSSSHLPPRALDFGGGGGGGKSRALAEASPVQAGVAVVNSAVTLLPPFQYTRPYHATAQKCQDAGCPLNHVVIKDLIANPQSSDRKKLREAVRRCELVGTAKVPAPGELGTNSMRDEWWWHEGDPGLHLARRLLQRR